MVFVLISWKNFKNLWNFLSERYLCYANEVTQGGPYMAWGWELDTRKTNQVIRKLELSATWTPQRECQGGRGEYLEIEFNHVTSNELPITRRLGSILVGEYAGMREGGSPWLHGDKSSCTQDPPRPCPMYLICRTFPPFIYSTFLILWLILENSQT